MSYRGHLCSALIAPEEKQGIGSEAGNADGIKLSVDASTLLNTACQMLRYWWSFAEQEFGSARAFVHFSGFFKLLPALVSRYPTQV